MAAEDSVPDSIQVGVDDGTAWVRVSGRARFSGAHALREFAARMLAEGRFLLAVDLADCVSMDSTFIGTLAMIATEGEPQIPVVRLLNIRENVADQLGDLGVSRVFEFGSSEACPLPGAGMGPVDAAGADKGDRNRTVLAAHETLTELSPRNEPKFRDVIAFLRDADKGRD